MQWNGGLLATQAWASTQLAGKLNATNVQTIGWSNSTDSQTLEMADDGSLKWGSDVVITRPDVSLYSQQDGATILMQSDESASPPVYGAWSDPSANTVVNTTGYSTYTLSSTAWGGPYTTALSTVAAGTTVVFSVELRAGTATSVAFGYLMGLSLIHISEPTRPY